MRIVLCYPVTDQHVDQLTQAFPEAEIVDAGQSRINDALPTADIFIGHAKVPVDWDRVVTAGRLKFIQSSAAGLDHCLTPPVIDSDIPVAGAAGLFAPQVAEQTFAILFGLLRGLPRFFDAETRHEFVRLPTDDLRGKTVGIVGLGGNGREIARMLSPWSVRLIATDFYPVDRPSHVDQLWPADRLDDLVAQSDIVILTPPLNAQTHGMIDASVLQNFKPGGYLINVARGPIVVESALVAALDSGRLSGAGLDVTEVEPLSIESALWNRDNVIITPHVGAQSYRRVDDTTDFACVNVRRFLDGERPHNIVDKTLGFPHPRDSYRNIDLLDAFAAKG